MPSRPARAAALLLALGWPGAEALAWTDATRARMLRDALKVTPPALDIILERYEKDLQSGMIEPSRHEDEEVHFQRADGSGGLAVEAVVHTENEIRAILRNHRSLHRFAYEMGLLAHLAADIDFPLNASDSDPREPLYRDAYRAFIEKSLDKIPFVLDREPSRELERGDVRGFLMLSARRAGKNYALIGPAFKDDGTPRSPDALDERSVPFGIASLSYSYAVSDIVRLWTGLWKSVDGDLEGTPYLDAPPPEKVTIPPKPPKKRRPPAPEPSASPGSKPAPAASPSPGPSPQEAPPSGGPAAGPGARS